MNPPMRSKEYVLEKLAVAVDCLVGGTGPVQERLANAGVSALIRLDPEDFSAETRDTYDEIIEALSAVDPVGDEGAFTASARSMTAERAQEIGSKIVWLMYSVAIDL
jgi:hypothetical protein